MTLGHLARSASRAATIGIGLRGVVDHDVERAGPRDIVAAITLFTRLVAMLPTRPGPCRRQPVAASCFGGIPVHIEDDDPAPSSRNLAAIARPMPRRPRRLSRVPSPSSRCGRIGTCSATGFHRNGSDEMSLTCSGCQTRLPGPDGVPRCERIYFVSLGCPKNQVDTELMLGQVEAAGHSLVHAPDDADVIVVNTCAFIDAAKEESVDTSSRWPSTRRRARRKLVVTGCLAQRYSDDLAKDIPEIDHILGSSDFQSISKVLTPPKSNGRKKLPMMKAPAVVVTETPEYIYDHDAPRVRIGKNHIGLREDRRRLRSARARSASSPKLRGPQRQRQIADTVKEVEQLGREGVQDQPDRAGSHAATAGTRAPPGSRAKRSPSSFARWARSTASTGSVCTTRSRARSTTI